MNKFSKNLRRYFKMLRTQKDYMQQVPYWVPPILVATATCQLVLVQPWVTTSNTRVRYICRLKQLQVSKKEIKIFVFCNATSCSTVGGYYWWECTCSFRLQDTRVKTELECSREALNLSTKLYGALKAIAVKSHMFCHAQFSLTVRPIRQNYTLMDFYWYSEARQHWNQN